MEEVNVTDSRALEVVAREPDPKLSENALRVLQKRYLKKDDKGRVVETPRQLFARVAWNLAQAERNYGANEIEVEEKAKTFFRIMSNLEFLPNSPPLGENFTRDRVFDGTGYSHALVAQDNGPAEIYSIETELGLRIGATYNHALAVVDENGEIVWREAQDLREGDWLVIVKGGHLGIDRSLPPLGPQHPNATRIRVPSDMNAELSELLGLYMADGCTSTGGRFIITVGTVDIEVMERIRILMDRSFGFAPNQITEGEGRGYVDIQFQSRDLVRWMERLGWVKGSSPNAFIPTEILTGSADSARAFL